MARPSISAPFISPDPLMNPGDPKTLDPYRYADNNPVVFTDAIGLYSSACISSTGAAKAKCETLASNYKPVGSATPFTPGTPDGGGSRALPGKAVAAMSVAVRLLEDWLGSEDGRNVADFMGHPNTSALVNSGIACNVKGSKTSCGVAAGAVAFSGSCQSAQCATDSATREAFAIMDIFLENFPGHRAWDAKAHLRRNYGLSDSGDDADKWFSLDPGRRDRLYYDVYGNFQFGIMMQRWGFSQDNAQAAQLMGGPAGPALVDDSPAVQMGYEFGEMHPGSFSARDALSFLLSPSNFAQLDSAGKVCGPSASTPCPTS